MTYFEFCQANNLTQDQLAALTGLSKIAIAKGYHRELTKKDLVRLVTVKSLLHFTHRKRLKLLAEKLEDI